MTQLMNLHLLKQEKCNCKLAVKQETYYNELYFMLCLYNVNNFLSER
jgi:hypothetical protein